MSEDQKELIFDLLTKKAIYGLDEAEQRMLDGFDSEMIEAEYISFEAAAAAISLIGIDTDEQMPVHLRSKILDEANRYVGSADSKSSPARQVYAEPAERPGSSLFNWFGWAVAFAACAALVANIWLTRYQPEPEVVRQPAIETPRVKTPAERREEMLRSGGGIIRASWAGGNVKELKEIAGDIVWSDQTQSGYMRFRGLPINDPTRETYQLWIMDKSRDTNLIDGGTFDVTSAGEVVIPINAKLRVQSPEMFAVTIEQPGGVVVSKKEKLVALAKVERPTV